MFFSSTSSAFLLGRLIAASTLSLALGCTAMAADTQATPVQNVQLDDFVDGKKALESKSWQDAVNSFNKVVAKNPKNADAYNYLGYASRWLGKYDDAFAAYGKALAIDPQHKGALSYSGIAYLKSGQKSQADIQLVKLQAICMNCSETSELAKAVADYKPVAK